ncbi:hypothetical protein GCK72_018740 [Caenorhabditis remanei]|uniref:Uncharacterized protein n=1 Tax=Caenorhabditis remanei TaxID=31234 RepID=A0A6A5GBF3_CAERE|nr:hypothetical protein GCK72_018740 [Caenorhabditis remanei]KAF1752186.1 hypothetical protein GCK72_018740 [Caenorhabditis remanei]
MKEVSCKNIRKGIGKNGKKIRRVPNRQFREVFKSLMISKRQPTISADKAYAMKMKKVGGKHENFVKTDLLGDIMDNKAHKVGMPIRYSSTIYAPPDPLILKKPHYLYKTYNFLDDLTKYDIYRRAAHYSNMKNTFRKKRALEEYKLAGLAVCANFEVRRRREKIRLRGRWRPEYSNYGKRMLGAARKMVFKLQKNSQPYFAQLIVSKKDQARTMMNTMMSTIKFNLQNHQKETRARIERFKKHNQDYIKDRKKCFQNPIMLNSQIVNRHHKMPYRRRGNQDLFSEFNYFSSHLAFSAHFCKVIRSFRVDRAKEDEVIQKSVCLTPLIRIRKSRYTNFPVTSVVSYNENEELQLTLPRVSKKAPSIVAVSGYSSDSGASAATDTPLDWELDWKYTDKKLEHRMALIGDTTRYISQTASEKHYNQRRWKEETRRKMLLFKADNRLELSNKVPIFKEITKMHPPFIYCNVKGMELKKLRKSKFLGCQDSEKYESIVYVIKQRMHFLEKTLPCKDDPRILLNQGWKNFGIRQGTSKFEKVAKILKQRSTWVTKSCVSRAATVPRCDKLPMVDEELVENK